MSGTTVLLSTAYLDEAERCTDVMLLDEGELLDHGSPEAFRGKIRGRCYRTLAVIGLVTLSCASWLFRRRMY